MTLLCLLASEGASEFPRRWQEHFIELDMRQLQERRRVLTSLSLSSSGRNSVGITCAGLVSSAPNLARM
eukprot:498481-Hanusia_phi.AAC.1